MEVPNCEQKSREMRAIFQNQDYAGEDVALVAYCGHRCLRKMIDDVSFPIEPLPQCRHS